MPPSMQNALSKLTQEIREEGTQSRVQILGEQGVRVLTCRNWIEMNGCMAAEQHAGPQFFLVFLCPELCAGISAQSLGLSIWS